jgi:hypothetical protein
MPNLFHCLGDTAERIGARIAACAHDIALHLKLHWAEFRGDHNRALLIMKEIYVADLSKLTAAVDRAVAKSAADAVALQAALDANANLQPDIDALTDKLDAIAPEGDGPAPAPVEEAGADPVIEPPVPDLNPNAQ